MAKSRSAVPYRYLPFGESKYEFKRPDFVGRCRKGALQTVHAERGARIQSFPDSFVLNDSELKSYRQIGNAIPPVMMWHVAKAL